MSNQYKVNIPNRLQKKPFLPSEQVVIRKKEIKKFFQKLLKAEANRWVRMYNLQSAKRLCLGRNLTGDSTCPSTRDGENRFTPESFYKRNPKRTDQSRFLAELEKITVPSLTELESNRNRTSSKISWHHAISFKNSSNRPQSAPNSHLVRVEFFKLLLWSRCFKNSIVWGYPHWWWQFEWSS